MSRIEIKETFELARTAVSILVFRSHNKNPNEEDSSSKCFGTGDIRERERNNMVGRICIYIYIYIYIRKIVKVQYYEWFYYIISNVIY